METMTSQNPTILCVDNEKANIDLLEAILGDNGYKVVSAMSGEDALLKIKNQTIDLVILDILMSGMSGLEVCRQIKEDQRLREIPIIMVTGLASIRDRVRGIETGADDYFTKPFHEAEVLARIKILLKAKKLNDERKETLARLEELNRVFVGRELKMIELKKRIADLESKKA